jgi:hypothetical protein
VDTYDFGDPVTLELQVRDATGALVTPTTITLITRDPDAVEAAVVPDTIGIGLYSATLLPDVAGTWLYRWETTGPGEGAHEGGFTVTARFTTPGPAWTPSPAQVAVHVPTRGPFTSTSRPTAAQVAELAVQVAHGLALEIGDRTLTAAQQAVARSYTEHATAARVEYGWFPEQQDRDGVGAQQDLWAGQELVRLRRALGLDPESLAAASDGEWAGSVAFSPPPRPLDVPYGGW